MSRQSAVMADKHNALLQALHDGLNEMQLVIPQGAAEKLIRYIELLHKWNHTHNLTAIKNIDDMVRRHVLDSLSMLRFTTDDTMLDVGAGAGLPGIPLAICKPDLDVTLVDSVQKKTLFMSFAGSHLGLQNILVKHQRVELLRQPPGYHMVVARAFSSLEKLCLLTKHLLAEHGQILAMTGFLPEPQEVEDLQKNTGFHLVKTEKLFVAGEHAERNIVILQHSAD